MLGIKSGLMHARQSLYQLNHTPSTSYWLIWIRGSQTFISNYIHSFDTLFLSHSQGFIWTPHLCHTLSPNPVRYLAGAYCHIQMNCYHWWPHWRLFSVLKCFKYSCKWNKTLTWKLLKRFSFDGWSGWVSLFYTSSKMAIFKTGKREQWLKPVDCKAWLVWVQSLCHPCDTWFKKWCMHLLFHLQ